MKSKFALILLIFNNILISRSFAVFIKMDVIKTFQFSGKKLNGRKMHPYWEPFPSKKDTRSDCS